MAQTQTRYLKNIKWRETNKAEKDSKVIQIKLEDDFGAKLKYSCKICFL